MMYRKNKQVYMQLCVKLVHSSFCTMLYVSLLPPDGWHLCCSSLPLFPFNSSLTFMFWFWSLLQSCMWTWRVSKLVFGLVVLNSLSLITCRVGVHALAFESELLCSFNSRQFALLCVCLHCYCEFYFMEPRLFSWSYRYLMLGSYCVKVKAVLVRKEPIQTLYYMDFL